VGDRAVTSIADMLVFEALPDAVKAAARAAIEHEIRTDARVEAAEELADDRAALQRTRTEALEVVQKLRAAFGEARKAKLVIADCELELDLFEGFPMEELLDELVELLGDD
jgi:hypothetical protein